ncbi:hypothetical protein [Pseudoalteromonas luteoviolacea]|uniref:Uncharacterized protein n=1 Tax=Pseudoalteromonas luteoviolacea S4060-1 TaxID=1365257 RepID=A0A167L083_9GAMM|nr:hypothetical protein [Pseudoalteromonas luteoviolacea]KZN38912.1 hypothetical protein N480_11825 [Pseudoalteromonas luteoviolacea S2607]KZN63601.1 hypothetical protein N478_23975 [Pseudoalteromonas luteoviolacea S4060-1]
MNYSRVSLLATLFSSFSLLAVEQSIVDVDGFERVTNYAYGPVQSAIIVSERAHKLSLHVNLRDAQSDCGFANVYSIKTYSHLSTLNITKDVDDANSLILETELNDESALLDSKTVHINCTDAQGSNYTVQVNIPGAPVVDWQISLEPAGEFVYQPYSFGYHSAYKIKSLLRVNNQNTQSYCTTLANRGVSLGLFNGEDKKGPFHSDVFVKNEVVVNDAQPVLYQIIECENAAGKTMAVKVFNLTNPNLIHTWEDQLIIK